MNTSIFKFVIRKSPSEYLYLKVDPKAGILWIRDEAAANRYPSRYAAKQHINKLDSLPDSVRILEV